jgi:DNA-binding FadR family transcriptional regulator
LEFATHRQRSIKFHREIYAAIEKGGAPKARKIMADVLQFAEIQTPKVLGIDSGRTRK